MSNGTVAAQAIPFPPTPAVYNGTHYTPAQAFQGLATSAPIVYWDQTSLQFHTATISANDGKNLTVNSEGKSIVMPISGDGTATLPVALLVSP
jgi:hypothetical protein